MLAGVVFPSFLWSLVRFNCACNSGVDYLSRLQGCDLKAEGLWALSRILHELWMHRLWTRFCWHNLTVRPCFLDGFPTSLTRCGTLDGIHNRWDFQVNFVEVIWWTNSHKLSLKLRLRRNLQLLGSKIQSWINNLRHKLNLISSISNSFFLSINLHPLHIHLSPHHQRQNHQHRWHLNPHHLDPVFPLIQRRWCSRWRIRSNPVCRLLWTRTKSATRVILHSLHSHQFQSLRPFPAILLHQMNSHHHNVPTVAPALIVIVQVPEYLTNVRSPFHAVHVDKDPPDEYIVHLDHALHPEDVAPRREMFRDVQAELHRSHYGQPLHVVEKYHMEEMMIIHFMNPVTGQPVFTLQRGNTTHNHLLTLSIPSPTTTTTTITPPTSGNPGANGRTIPSLPTHPTHLVGSVRVKNLTSNNGTSTFVLTFLVSSALFQVIPSKGNREPGDWSCWTVNRMPPVGGYGKGWATCSPKTSTRNKGAEWTRRWEPGDWSCWTVNRMPPVGGYGKGRAVCSPATSTKGWTRRWEPGDWSCWTVNRMPPVGGYGKGRAVCSPATSTKGWTRWWEPGDWSCWTVNRMPPVGGYGKGRAVCSCSPATSTKGWTRRWEPGDWSCWTVNRMPPVGGYGKGWAICSPATSARRKRTK